MTTAELNELDLDDSAFDWVQKRSGRGSSSRRRRSDVYIYLTGSKKPLGDSGTPAREQVAVRLSLEFMETIGWQDGEYLCIGCKDDDGVIALKRTTDRSEGYRLSKSGKDGVAHYCCMKFTPVPGSWLYRLLTSERSFSCRVIKANANRVHVAPIFKD
jgi:hypothetical protein